MRETIVHLLIIVVIAGTVFFTNLGTARLWDRDEPRNAGCAAEMMARGDWVVPIFNDQLRKQKPALLYWLMIGAYSVFGVNEFSARFWSALLGIGTCLATYVIGRRLFDPRIGLVASIALASSMMFVVAARAATPDSLLVFCSTLSLMFFVQAAPWKKQKEAAGAHRSNWFPANVWYVAAMYGCMGLAVLAKGPVGFLLPMAMIGMFGLLQSLPTQQNYLRGDDASWWQRLLAVSWDCVRAFHPMHFAKTLGAMRPLMAAAIILAIALPWFIWVHVRTEGDFTRLFFVGEHFGRATIAQENHGGGLWFYPMAILLGFFPWSCFWGPTLIGLLTGNGQKAELKNKTTVGWSSANCFLLCWVCVQVGAFSIAKTKLPSYVTPCYPALAILTASGLVQFCRQLKMARSTAVHRGWFYAAFGGLAIGGCGIVAGLYFGLGEVLPQQRWLAVFGVVPLVAGIVSVALLVKQKNRFITPTYCGASVLLVWLVFGFGTVVVDQQRQSLSVLEQVSQRPGAVATYGCHESSWVFYGQKPITELIPQPMPKVEQTESQVVWASFEVSPKTEQVESDRVRKFWQPVPWLRVDQFVQSHTHPSIITTGEHLPSLLAQLPPDFVVIAEAPSFLKPKADKGKTLYLVGRTE